MNRRRGWIAVAAVALVVVAAAGIGWALASAGDRPERAGAASSLEPVASGTGSDSGTGASPGATGGPDPGAGAPADPPGGQQPDPPPAGPQIEVFRVAQQPRCPAGTDVNPIEGEPVALEWRVTGADEVTLSIDGPGVYASYPAEGSDTFSYACTGDEGDVERHTYLLTATGGGQTVTSELVVEAVVYGRADV